MLYAFLMLKLFLVSYDLTDASGDEYERLISELSAIGKNGNLHILKSAFFVVSELSATQINERIKTVVNKMRPNVTKGSNWLVTPISLADSTGWLNKDKVDWWDKAMAVNL
jgi:hypothetical protein